MSSPLPFHPGTGVQAIGFGKRGPIWPVMGASEDHAGGIPGQQQGGADQNGQQGQQNGGQQQAGSDKGFPPDTPVAEMTDTQKAAYYKFQNRQTDGKLAAFHGFTPDDVNSMWSRLQELEGEKLNADQKALRDASTKAANDAKSQAEAEWRPKYQAAQLKSAVSEVLKDKEQRDSFLAMTDPAKFVGEDGEIDEEKVMGHLTALFGGNNGNGQQQQANGQQRSWGQHSGGNSSPGTRPGEAGKAALAKRHGVKTT